jgi:1,4-dihydroxy-2-naphthoate octaprenyltransferase
VRLGALVEAARPRTLPAAVAPVLVGTAVATRVIAWRVAAALLTAVALQVAVNYANDYSDGVRGIDTEARVGPRRAVASGLIEPGSMRWAIAAALLVAGLAGGALALAVGPELFAVGIACGLAALAYSGGPRPYASAGLGELFVFVFFGLVATVGSQYVQDEAVAAGAWLPAVAVGSLAVALLVVNNLRDVPTDRALGKRTLAVRLGEPRTRLLYLVLLVVPFGLVPAIAVAAGSGWPLLALLAVFLAREPADAVAAQAAGADLIAVLGATGRVQLAYAALLALGLALA